MHRSAATPILPKRLGRAWGLPWLLSSLAHLALLVILGLTLQVRQGSAARSSPTSGMALTIVNEVQPMSAEDDRASDAEEHNRVELAQAIGPLRNETDDLPASLIAALADEQKYELAQLPTAPPDDLTSQLPASAGPGAAAKSDRKSPPSKTSAEGSSAAGGSKSGARGGQLKPGYARTGVFGVEGEGRKFVYVFDRSGSMSEHGGAPLAAAKDQLIASLQDIGPTQQFQIIFYNEHPRVFNPTGATGRLVFGTDQNKTLAERFIRGITADGGTEHEEALAKALGMTPDVIFFLTDADEPQMTSKQLARIERLNNGTIINAIQFGYGPQNKGENFLVRLAQRNGGQHVYVDASRLPRPR